MSERTSVCAFLFGCCLCSCNWIAKKNNDNRTTSVQRFSKDTTLLSDIRCWEQSFQCTFFLRWFVRLFRCPLKCIHVHRKHTSTAFLVELFLCYSFFTSSHLLHLSPSLCLTLLSITCSIKYSNFYLESTNAISSKTKDNTNSSVSVTGNRNIVFWATVCVWKRMHFMSNIEAYFLSKHITRLKPFSIAGKIVQCACSVKFIFVLA